MKKPFRQLRIHCIAPRQEGLDDVVRDLVEDNVLEDEDDNVDVVCNRVVRVVEVCGVDVVDIGVVFCCVITGDDVSGGLVVTTCDVVPVVVVDWVEAGCNVMAWAIENIARSQGLKRIFFLLSLRCKNTERENLLKLLLLLTLINNQSNH